MICIKLYYYMLIINFLVLLRLLILHLADYDELRFLTILPAEIYILNCNRLEKVNLNKDIYLRMRS